MHAEQRSGTSTKYVVIALAAVAALLIGLSGGKIIGLNPVAKTTATAISTAASNPVADQPAPDLFKAKDLLLVTPILYAQKTRAATNIEDFWSDQLTSGATDDNAFIKWASRQVKSEPSSFVRRADQAKAAALLPTVSRQNAARWLNIHGCRDIWVSYALENKRLHGDNEQTAKESDLNLILDLAAKIVQNTQDKYAPSGGSSATPATPQSPCTPRTSPDRADCSCSFPSAVAAMSAAARVYLSAVSPRSAAEYRWAEKQADTAPVFSKLELTSDIESGSYLGYLVGKYFLASRGIPDLSATPTPAP